MATTTVWGVPQEMLGLSDCVNVTSGNVSSGFGTVLGTVRTEGDGTLDGTQAGSGDI